VIARLLLWSVAERPFALDELPPLEPPSAWLWNEAGERFGALLVDDGADDVPAALAAARERIAREPDVYEEFDVLSP